MHKAINLRTVLSGLLQGHSRAQARPRIGIFFAALTPRAVIEGTMDDKTIGLRASLLAQFFGAAVDEIAESGMAVVMINQLRDRIGGNGYGKDYIRPGGRAKDFYASVAADMHSPDFETLTKNKKGQVVSTVVKTHVERPIGMVINGKMYKNIVGPNFAKFAVQVRFKPGLTINRAAELADFGEMYGIFTNRQGEPLKTTGGFWCYNGSEIGKGRDEVLQKLKENTDLAAAVEHDIQTAIRDRKTIFSTSQNGSETQGDSSEDGIGHREVNL